MLYVIRFLSFKLQIVVRLEYMFLNFIVHNMQLVVIIEMIGCGALILQHPQNKSFAKYLVAASDIRLVQSEFDTFVHLGMRVQDI